ncbi:hypothetical protein SAMN05216238_101414 [Lentibacillus persicus]|uniref:Uncharacterized protein n=1 Tax=Lentibacillus persicus TaxID=640948 RepID=A0A1I1SGS8_9BACI|nr:hypothetical protein SAMN05216238_101414 [Lentibacillus persicus]
MRNPCFAGLIPDMGDKFIYKLTCEKKAYGIAP